MIFQFISIAGLPTIARPQRLTHNCHSTGAKYHLLFICGMKARFSFKAKSLLRSLILLNATCFNENPEHTNCVLTNDSVKAEAINATNNKKREIYRTNY